MTEIPRSPFGRTGHQSTRTLFGAAALGRVTQAEADQTMELLLDSGVNHIDTANSYGESEQRLGPWTGRYRDRFFLATKTEERSYAAAKEHLHRSLDLLRTDHIDLWQMHCLVKPDEWERAMGAGGALEAFIEAREQGLVRFIGVTGHYTVAGWMHRRSLERYDFDSVLLPFNYAMMQNATYRADFDSLMAICAERDVAVQTIKSCTRGPWAGEARTAATWYEPFSEQSEVDAAVHWVLNRPGVFLNTPGDIHLLPKVLDAARRFVPGPQDERDAAMADLAPTPLFM
ncbi:aldo/keto reductase [Oscillochloris sp. ZM17-4]|uniref:aldo/keto reductase n=1 Tax=Oscillochloris sp. ZM17-4 TaxID=2866714 RepID=UPI001C731E50|nr:aldo/keto reductase [Oscillochloris sp. ZM17-4]MBX0327187.1 aldo/keto reductase [Oscillochloris sp. ZM17-4]